MSIDVSTQKGSRGRIRVSATADRTELWCNRSKMRGEASIPFVFGDDAGSSHGQIVLVGPVDGLEHLEACAQGAKELGAIGNGPIDWSGLLEQLGGKLLLKPVEPAFGGPLVDHSRLCDADEDVSLGFDCDSQRASRVARAIAGAESLGVFDAELGQPGQL